MSLLDLFRHKQPATAASPWQLRLAQAEGARHFAWRDDNAPARVFVQQVLSEAAPQFGNGKIVDGGRPALCSALDLYVDSFGSEPMKTTDRNVELHGVYDGRPVRITVSIPGKRIWAIQMPCTDNGLYFRAVRDPSRAPTPRDPNDPWENSRPPECVFVGKAILLDNFGQRSDFSVPQWGATPAPARELVLRAMEQLDLHVFELSNTEASVFALGNRTLDALEDPLAYMTVCAHLLAEFVKLHGDSPAPASFSSHSVREPVTCHYCTSRFYLAPDHNTCPNCGAPAE